MEKQKIIKIVAIAVVIVGAIIYYICTKNNQEKYDDFLIQNLVVSNTYEEENNTVKEEKTKIKVYVTGEVNSPGVIELDEGARIDDAIKTAGGITSNADIRDINLAYEVDDGDKIYIPSKEEEQNQSNENLIGSEKEYLENNSSIISSSNGKVNINKATVTELTGIPGVGQSTAEKIVAYREENGKFSSIEDIQKVSGIGSSKYQNIKDYISVK